VFVVEMKQVRPRPDVHKCFVSLIRFDLI
jgi:hypothetical protein